MLFAARQIIYLLDNYFNKKKQFRNINIMKQYLFEMLKLNIQSINSDYP